ncbi:hypothetical protein [Pseudonocardia sp. H11422]|uniref:hypothetical protein n=1 Tax=Pseudonocardia sp. H11422 TaxID=2835866 RepID=UPI001BDDC16C|nr:hypothetical protein [Pseudonocardia sp. H11422]
MTRYVVIDQGWDLDAMIGQLQCLPGDDVVFRTIPTLRSDLRTPADGIAVEIDAREVRYFVQAALTGAVPTAATPAPGTRSTTAAGRESALPAPTTTAQPTTAPAITADGVPCVD